MADSARPYFPSLVVDGAPVTFAHLEPLQVPMTTLARPQGLIIEARFSNHCFSERFDPAAHPHPVDVWDRGSRRVFCPVRYELSKAFPAIVAALPTAHVYQTPETNFVRITVRHDGVEGEYRMFFRLKRVAPGAAHQLELFVESAYAPGQNQGLPARRMTKVRFALLVDKTLRGEKLRFHQKR